MSLMDKFKNLVDFKLSKVLDDPEAASFAAEKAQEKAAEDAVDEKKENVASAKQAEADRIKSLEAAKPPTPAQSAWSTFKKVGLYGIAIFLATILGSMCANAAIHRHPLIRLLAFIYGSFFGVGLLITSILTLFIPLGIFILTIIILGVLGNLPHLYAYLPLSTYQSPNKIVYYLLSLFTFDPNSDYNKDHIKNKTSEYKQILEASLFTSSESNKETS